MEPNLQEIVRRFRFEGDFSSASPYGAGHINDTYIAAFNLNGSTQPYILQQINHYVFSFQEGLIKKLKDWCCENYKD